MVIGLYKRDNDDKFVAAGRIVNKSGTGPVFDFNSWNFFKNYVVPATSAWFNEDDKSTRDSEGFVIQTKNYKFKYTTMTAIIPTFGIEQNAMSEFHTSGVLCLKSNWMELLKIIPDTKWYMQFMNHLAEALNATYTNEFIGSVLNLYKTKYSSFYIISEEFVRDFMEQHRDEIAEIFIKLYIDDSLFEIHKPIAQEILFKYYKDFLVGKIILKLNRINNY